MKINIYHQNIKGDNKPSKDLCTLVHTVQKDKELLRENFRSFLYSIKKIAIENCRETSHGDIIEIMPFDTCFAYEIGQFIIEEDGYRRIDYLSGESKKTNRYVFQKYGGLMVYFDTALPQEDIFTLFGTVGDDEFEEKLLSIQDLHVRSRTYNFARDDLKNDGITCEVIQYVKIPRQAIFNETIIKAMCAAHEPFIGIDTSELCTDGTAWAIVSLDDKGVFHVEPVPKDKIFVLDSIQVVPKKEVKKPFYRELEKKSRSGK